MAVRVHDHVPLPVSRPDDGTRGVDRGPQDPRAARRRSAVRNRRALLGVCLLGESGVGRLTHWLAAAGVGFGGVLSGFFIVATNAWMQHPVGYRVAGDHVELTSLWALLTNPYVRWQYPHVLAGAMITGSMVMAGTRAYYLLARRDGGSGRPFVRVGVGPAVVCSLAASFPHGGA